MSAIRHWLTGLGFEQFAEAFEQNQIDLDIVRDLADQDLRDLGVSVLGHRKLILRAIAALKTTARESPADESPVPSAITTHEGERRQLTVLFCDMVGFTELASRVDPEVLRRIIRAYEDACAVCITRYEGYVFQRLGDGIVAFFGYPLAHEGEAERAIHAGLAIIEALSTLDVSDAGHLAVRIGIATGLVVVSSLEKGAVGETMNLASRLQSIAPVSSIVVSERVQRLAGGTFEYEDLGEKTLKGITRPTRAFRIVGVGEAASRFEAATQEGLTPLVGREQEIGLLMERWALAQDGEGQVVLLSGEPGIGKSRILSALRERLEAQRAHTLRFQCSPYYVNSAFWPSIDNFERALRFGRDEPMESKLDKLEALIVTHYGRPLSDVRFVASMLSIPYEERYGAITMTPQKFKDETLRTLVDLTEAAARKQPSVMLFEDAHWADPTSLEVLDLLIDRVRTIPLLIVLTHRPEFQSRWTSHGHVISLNLSKLTRAQSGAMVARLTGGKGLPAALLEQILTKTDGVPLFVEELTKSILESGELKEAGDHYAYVGSAQSITIPATLRDSLMARLDRFMPVKEIAQIGAAIGREFSHELIEAIAPMSKVQLDSALSQLTDSGLAFRRGTPPDALYTFKHALVQDAAYDSLLKSRRQELHGKIARVIEQRFPATKDTEPELLAHHLTAAGLTQEAIPLWQKAGELAQKRWAFKEAVSHLDRGVGLISALPASRPRDEAELSLRTVLGTVWMALKGWGADEAKSAFAPTLQLARSLGRNDALLPILWGFFSFDLNGARIASAIDQGTKWLDLANEMNDQELLVAGHMAASVAYLCSGQLTKAREHGDQMLQLYREDRHDRITRTTNHEPRTVLGVFASHWTWMLGFPDQAVQFGDDRDAHARRYGHPFSLGHSLIVGAEIFDWRREPAAYRKRADEALRLAEENSLPWYSTVMVPTMYAVAKIREGSYLEGAKELGRLLTIRESNGQRLRIPYFKSVLAEATAHLGELNSALLVVNEAIEQAERAGWEERAHYAELLRIRGWVLSLKGNIEGAEQNYFASLDWARTQQAKSWELRTSTSLAQLWRSQGKRKEALDLLKPVYEWFTEGFDTNDLKEAKALLEDLGAR